MQRFAPGQRWISIAEPELGLGTLLRLDGRNVQVLFAAANVMRVYAAASAPLTRAEFRPGDRVNTQGQAFVVEAVEERDNVLHYRRGEAWVPEGALDDVQNVSKAGDRLTSGRVDRLDRFDLRLSALTRRAHALRHAGYGILSSRIDLIPHQLRVAEIASNRRPPRVLFADEVGLGKTIEASLVIARSIASGRVGRVLILVPEALVYQWFVELLRRFNLSFSIFDAERVESIELENDGRNPFQDEQLVITDLPFVLSKPGLADQLAHAGWDMLVVDEAHHLQWSPEETSPGYALVEQLARRTPGVLLLTATPEQLGRAGHFARLRLLDPARFHDLSAYQAEAHQYVALSGLAEALQGEQALDAEQLALLRQLLTDEPDVEAMTALAREDAAGRRELLRRLIDRHGTGRVMFRNRRAVVGGFPKREPLITIAPADSVDAARREALLEEFHGDVAQPPFAPALNYADDPRLPWLIDLLDAHPREKFLLICRTQPKLHALEEALRTRSGVALARFHEGLGIVQRDRNAAHFADPEGARLLLCTEIGSEGRNFQFASHLILWDLPADPDLLEQRIGRLDRIGQSKDISLHAFAVEGSAQHALLSWFDRALDALRASPEDGRELLKRFGERVVDTALACARGLPDAGAQLDALIDETRSVHEELAATIARGRDRLLELATRHADEADHLMLALRDADSRIEDDDFVLKLFEHFGVTVDELGPRTVLLDPEMLTTEAFPGLDQPRQATFDRRTALAREDMLFLRADHPMVEGAIELLLGSEVGNAVFLIDDSLPARTALLEAVFVLECVAPVELGIERFLPPLPVRAMVDSKLADRREYSPSTSTVDRAMQRTIDLTRYRKTLTALIPPMLAQAEKYAARDGEREIARALDRADLALRSEVDRLRALARVNPAVRAEEIENTEQELERLREYLPQARLRLDSLRFIGSGDFLALRQ